MVWEEKNVGVTTMKKNILIRADANHNIGMGHIMRTLSIADAFTSIGNSVCFLLADDTVQSLVRSRGYKTVVLHSDYKRMEDEIWPQDIYADLIIVDSYYLFFLREKMSTVGGKLVYIDDVCAFPYPVDIVIDYNAYATSPLYEDLYRDSRVRMPQLILGPTYAPLRSMFRGIEKKEQPKKVENILISTGGSDCLHLSVAIAKAVVSSVKDERFYHFLLGVMNADKEFIQKLAEKDEHIVVHENVTDMKSLISSMDLAISAAGSTLFEISACGIPLITYAFADNQLPGAEAFERLGLAVNVGDLRASASINPGLVMSGTLDPSAVDRILKAAEELSDNYERRVMMAKQMQEMIDGFGADRIVKEIL